MYQRLITPNDHHCLRIAALSFSGRYKSRDELIRVIYSYLGTVFTDPYEGEVKTTEDGEAVFDQYVQEKVSLKQIDTLLTLVRESYEHDSDCKNYSDIIYVTCQMVDTLASIDCS